MLRDQRSCEEMLRITIRAAVIGFQGICGFQSAMLLKVARLKTQKSI